MAVSASSLVTDRNPLFVLIFYCYVIALCLLSQVVRGHP